MGFATTSGYSRKCVSWGDLLKFGFKPLEFMWSNEDQPPNLFEDLLQFQDQVLQGGYRSGKTFMSFGLLRDFQIAIAQTVFQNSRTELKKFFQRHRKTFKPKKSLQKMQMQKQWRIEERRRSRQKMPGR
jgi:hypothetical protein